MLVCANGSGHLVRTLRIAGELLRSDDQLEIDLLAAVHPERMLGDDPVWQRARSSRLGIRLVPFPSGRDLAKDPFGFAWGKHVPPRDLEAYDLVVSDNYVEVLASRPDAILSGSFLWHDVLRAKLPDSGAIRSYADVCEELLSVHAPPMIVNRYFATSAPLRRTRPVPVGMLAPVWSGPETGWRDRGTILFHSGSSPALRKEFAEFLNDGGAAPLLAAGMELVVDAELLPLVRDGVGVTRFDYGPSFLLLRGCVGRPGMGLIADCIAARVPLVSVYEDDSEMRHNASRLADLAMGADAGAEVGSAMRLLIQWIEDGAAEDRYVAAHKQLDLRGVDATVSYLRDRLMNAGAESGRTPPVHDCYSTR
jgi:hypothetical protein